MKFSAVTCAPRIGVNVARVVVNPGNILLCLAAGVALPKCRQSYLD